jgi:methyltransferase (TIGR00027 family)
MKMTGPANGNDGVAGPRSITTVSDTSLWIAAVRANESARPDAVFHDELAQVLAGANGQRIARSIPRRSMVAWGVVARTAAIDWLIEDAVQAGVDMVINLGAGLDTRPYRMDLPDILRWVELDFSTVMEFKAGKLHGHPAACAVQRIGVDLRDRTQRTNIFRRLGCDSRRALVITEGVLPYLANVDVSLLARDLHNVPAFELWIQDYDNAGKRRMPSGWAKTLKSAPFLFEPEDWFKFFRQCGWTPSTVITNGEAAARIHRPYPWDLPYGLLMRALPGDIQRRILGLSGATLLRRAELQPA